MAKLTPEDLINQREYELLAEVEHRQIKKFIFEQITPEVRLICWYSVYQIVMLLFLVFLLGKAVVLFTRGMPDALRQIGYAVLFSFTILIFLHEMVHAVAYRLCGARNLKAGVIWGKFIFYVMADREVINSRTFRIVAYAPLVFVKFCCLFLGILFWSSAQAYFFFSVMSIHSLFCAGDIAMLAFYRIHTGREIYSYDDLNQGKSFFYCRRNE